jgi:hypothetical protein
MEKIYLLRLKKLNMKRLFKILGLLLDKYQHLNNNQKTCILLLKMVVATLTFTREESW